MERLQMLNMNLAKVLKDNHISKLRLISFGNSIANGYSVCRTVKPLLSRNESIDAMMRKAEIEYEQINFTKASNNSEAKLFDMLMNDITLSEIYEINRKQNREVLDGRPIKIALPGVGIKEDEVETYYPKEVVNNLTINETFFTGGKEQANIIIYNGCTGSTLDNFLRDGNHFPTYGISRDVSMLRAILHYIQEKNRNGSNTQVYLCGAPDYLGTKITNIINCRIKALSKCFANTTYIKSQFLQTFYRNLQGKIGFDSHYNESEYVELNEKIVESIISNYEKKSRLIKADRKFVEFQEYLDLENPQEINDTSNILKVVGEILSNNFMDKYTLKEASKYLQSVAPYDFHCIRRSNIKEATKSLLKTFKKSSV